MKLGYCGKLLPFYLKKVTVRFTIVGFKTVYNDDRPIPAEVLNEEKSVA